MSDDLPDFDLDLVFHRTLFFCDISTRLKTLHTLLRISEQQLEVARKEEISLLRKEHKKLGKSLWQDEKENDLWMLEMHITHLMPKMFRGGYLFALWSVFERSLMDIAQKAALQRGVSLAEDHFRKGSFFPAMQSAIRLCSGVDAFSFSRRDEKIKLRLLKSVRQTLIHHDGRLSEAPQNLQQLTYEEIERMGLILEKDEDVTYVLPTEPFLADSTELVINCINRVKEQVYDALFPDTGKR